jgi:hypothetical protein
MDSTKVCGLEKSLNEFRKDFNLKDGHRNECKECVNKKSKDNYHTKNGKNDEKILIKRRYQQLLDTCHKKFSTHNNLDEISELENEYHEILQNYRREIEKLSSMFNFSIFNKLQDNDLARNIIQEYLSSKNIVVPMNEIIIENVRSNIKISLPNQIYREDISNISRLCSQ